MRRLAMRQVCGSVKIPKAIIANQDIKETKKGKEKVRKS